MNIEVKKGMDILRVANKLSSDVRNLRADRNPICAGCGEKIPVWANLQGVLPATTISMLLCKCSKCNAEAVKDAKRHLRY
jgi:hypothetical protein